MVSLKSLFYKYIPEFIIKYLKKIHYYKKLKKINEFAEEDLMMLKDFIKEGDQVIDIGANFGAYTKIMSQKVGSNGKVYSFEPIPDTYNYLKYNIKKLKLNNVIAFNLAISDNMGKVKMEVPKFAGAGDNFYEARIVEKENTNFKTFEVNTDTLDNLYKSYGLNPSFIKCDVEGHEWFVFKEGKLLLSNCKPVLLIEINQDIKMPDANTSELLDLLKSLGYNIYINIHNHLKKMNEEERVNYWFLTEEHLSRTNKNNAEN